jgi:ferric-dicitrate binding protein FerR (iron transport regulator)
VSKKNEINAPQAQWWLAHLTSESVEEEERSAFHNWLLRGRWLVAQEIVTALLERFRRPPLDGRARKSI